MRILALCSISALGGSLILNAAGTSVAVDAQAEDETPANIIAAQIRKQGFTCDNAERAVRDKDLSKPDLPVYSRKLTVADSPFSGDNAPRREPNVRWLKPTPRTG